jgi:hypothetical protein
MTTNESEHSGIRIDHVARKQFFAREAGIQDPKILKFDPHNERLLEAKS